MQAEADQDVVKLLLVIQGYCCHFYNCHQSTWALEQAKPKHQVLTLTNTEYVEHFNTLVFVVKTSGGVYDHKPGLVTVELVAQGVRPKDVATADSVEISKDEEACQESKNV